MSHQQSQYEKSENDQIQITQQSSQEINFSNLAPEKNDKKSSDFLYYDKMQKLINLTKGKQAKIAEKRKRTTNLKNKQKIQQEVKQRIQKQQKQQRQRSRQKNKSNTQKNNKQNHKKQHIYQISDEEENQDQKYQMIQFQEYGKKNFNKENQNIENIMAQIDSEIEEGQVKFLPEKFQELQKQLDLQKWQQYQLSQRDYQARKAQKDHEKREKRKAQRLLQKKHKQSIIGKGKDKVSNSVFNGIQDYFL